MKTHILVHHGPKSVNQAMLLPIQGSIFRPSTPPVRAFDLGGHRWVLSSAGGTWTRDGNETTKQEYNDARKEYEAREWPDGCTEVLVSDGSCWEYHYVLGPFEYFLGQLDVAGNG